MDETIPGLNASTVAFEDVSQKWGGRSNTKRLALLMSAASAVGYGIWRRDRYSWPILTGSVGLFYAAARQAPAETTCEVSFTIDRPLSEVYSYFRDLNNWGRFMVGMQSPRQHGSKELAWTSYFEGGEVRSSISDERPGEFLRWSSSIGEREYDSEVRFQAAPGNRGTEVHWRSEPRNAANWLRQVVASSRGISLEQQARESLRALKQLLEAGEIPTTNGQPHGSRGWKGKASRAMFREAVEEKRQPARVAASTPKEQQAVS
jgi:uncharacterized membrane protein